MNVSTVGWSQRRAIHRCVTPCAGSAPGACPRAPVMAPRRHRCRRSSGPRTRGRARRSAGRPGAAARTRAAGRRRRRPQAAPPRVAPLRRRRLSRPRPGGRAQARLRGGRAAARRHVADVQRHARAFRPEIPVAPQLRDHHRLTMNCMASELEAVDYEAWLAGSTESAEVAVPLILEAVAPASVVDVGCGLGHWLAVVKEHGVDDVMGYDGPSVDHCASWSFPASSPSPTSTSRSP